MADKFYITTAIAYPNGPPHIGHAYEAIAADAIARFQRMQGKDVRLVTGTDEHGLKMAQTARAAGRDTLEFADEMAGYFKDMCNKLNVSYDAFVRTTEPRHHAASVALWQAMEAKGDLYLDRYEGWYSVRDEAFYDESELTEGEGGTRLSPQGTPVEWTQEETWFFRLAKYQEPLLALYRDNPDFIRPESRRNEVLRFVEGGLKDLSVSRTSFDWGVPVPGRPGHVMYVWVDALTTYLTGIGFPGQSGDFARFWPADLHLIGKDIVRFHTVYWPAFLMSAGLPLPRHVFGHGFLLARGGEKMSKSAGNVVDPLELAERFGVDQLRYFLLREVSFGQDGSYSAEAIVTRCNAELANSFGNLAQRVLSFVAKNCSDGLPWQSEASDSQQEVLGSVLSVCRDQVLPDYEKLSISVALEAWMSMVFLCNQFIDTEAPWALRKSDPDRMKSVLATLVACIRILAITVRPVVPNGADRILDQIGVPGSARNFSDMSDPEWFKKLVLAEPPQPVFPRLEMPAEADA